MTKNDEPSGKVAKFLEGNVFREMAILTIKSEHGPSLNITGPFRFWTIERFDKTPLTNETVITRPVDTIETRNGEEPPFHVHVNAWRHVSAARLRDHRADFLRSRYPRVLELLNDQGKAMLWWYVDHDHAAKLATIVGENTAYRLDD